MSIRDIAVNIRGPLDPWDGTVSPSDGAVRDTTDEFNALTEFEIAWAKTAVDAMASTATAETPVGFTYRAIDVVEIKIHPLAALTGDPTNNAVFTVSQRDSNGVNQLTVATLTTTASWVAFKPVSLVLSGTAANLILAAGSGLSVAITKGGTGVVVPVLNLVARVRLR